MIEIADKAETQSRKRANDPEALPWGREDTCFGCRCEAKVGVGENGTAAN